MVAHDGCCLQVRIWDAVNWKGLALTELIHPCVVYTARFQPEGTQPRIVASGGLDGLLRLWDRDSGDMLTTLCTTLVPKRWVPAPQNSREICRNQGL